MQLNRVVQESRVERGDHDGYAALMEEGSGLHDFDVPMGWTKVRGPVYIGAGIIVQLVGSIATLPVP